MPLYTGSNYGFISTANSGTATLTNPGDTSSFSFENVQNYINGSFLINITGTPDIKASVIFSDDSSGTISSTTSFIFNKTGSFTKSFQISGQFLKIEIESIFGGSTFTLQTRYNNTGLTDNELGTISALNSYYTSSSVSASSTPLSGQYEDISNYSLIVIIATADASSSPADGTFKAIFSQDGVNVDRQISYTVEDATANGVSGNSLTFNPPHTLIPICRYFKLEYSNGSQALTALRVTTQYHTSKSKPLTSRATQQLSDYTDADTTRNILTGRTFGTTLTSGRYENIEVSNGSLNVAVRTPNTAFGDLLVANNNPQTQLTFYDGIPLDTILINQNSPANTEYTTNNGLITIDAKSYTKNGFIEVLTKEFLKYKSGEGIDSKFSAKFGTYVAGKTQFVGLINEEDNLGFGYFTTSDFSIRYVTQGKQQVNTYTISGTFSGTTDSYDFIFGGDTVEVSLTSGDNLLQVSQKIIDAINNQTDLNTYGWSAQYFENTSNYLQFVRNYSDANITVTIPALTGITITPVTSLSRNGSAPTTTYITQDNWNIDTCKTQSTLTDAYNNNPSGFNLNPQNGNVYRITFQYLGFGAITFSIENPETGFFFPVHQIKYANSNSLPSFGNPNFRVGMQLENSTTDTTQQLSSASFSNFLQGKIRISPIIRSYNKILSGNSGTFGSGIKRVIFAIQGRNVFNSTLNSFGTSSTNVAINRTNIYLTSMNIALNVSTPQNKNFVFELIKSPTTITNNATPSTLDWKVIGDNLVYVLDGIVTTSSSTGITYTGGENIIDASLIENTNQIIDLTSYEILLSPEDTYLLTYSSDNLSGGYDVVGSLSWKINM